MFSGFSIKPALFRGYLKRFWPLWLVYFAVMALLFMVPMWAGVTGIAEAAASASDLASDLQHVWAAALFECVPFAFASSLIVAVSMNGYLFDAGEATFYGAAPIRRGTLFATVFLAGLVGLLAVPAVCAVVMGALVARVPVLGIANLGQWYAFLAVATFVFYSLAHLSCQVSGTRPVAVIVFCVANILAACVQIAVNLITSALVFGVPGWDVPIDWASPLVGIVRYGIDGVPLNAAVNWTTMGAYAATGACFTVICAWLNGRRNLEAAGEAVAYAGLRIFLKYLAGASTALMFGAATYLYFWAGFSATEIGADRVGVLFAMMAVGGFLGLVFAEMIMRRSSRVLGSCWKGGLALACASLALVGGCYADVLGVQSHVPDSGEVASVELACDGRELATLASAEATSEVTKLHGELLGLRGVDADTGFCSTVTVSYELRGGGQLQRSYPVFVGELEVDGPNGGTQPDRLSRGYAALSHLADIVNTEEGRASRFADILDANNDDVTFYLEAYDGDEGEDDDVEGFAVPRSMKSQFVERALGPDLMGGRAGAYKPAWAWEQTPETETGALLTATSGDDSAMLLELWLDTADTPNTIAWFKEHYPDADPDLWRPPTHEG